MFKGLPLYKWLILLSTLLAAHYSLAHNHKEKTVHDHKVTHQTAIGIHGMAVVQMDGIYYASHMPLANSIHAHQVIFSFRLPKDEQANLNALSKQSALVTLMPERFDLMKLISGEITEFSGTFFKNHFERGGLPVIEKATIKVEKMMLVSSLSATKNGRYYFLTINENRGLIVHKIASSNSFDQISGVTFKSTTSINQKVSMLNIGNSTPLNKTRIVGETFILQALENNVTKVEAHASVHITTAAPLYLETKDFQ